MANDILWHLRMVAWGVVSQWGWSASSKAVSVPHTSRVWLVALLSQVLHLLGILDVFLDVVGRGGNLRLLVLHIHVAFVLILRGLLKPFKTIHWGLTLLSRAWKRRVAIVRWLGGESLSLHLARQILGLFHERVIGVGDWWPGWRVKFMLQVVEVSLLHVIVIWEALTPLPGSDSRVRSALDWWCILRKDIFALILSDGVHPTLSCVSLDLRSYIWHFYLGWLAESLLRPVTWSSERSRQYIRSFWGHWLPLVLAVRSFVGWVITRIDLRMVYGIIVLLVQLLLLESWQIEGVVGYIRLRIKVLWRIYVSDGRHLVVWRIPLRFLLDFGPEVVLNLSCVSGHLRGHECSLWEILEAVGVHIWWVLHLLYKQLLLWIGLLHWWAIRIIFVDTFLVGVLSMA